MAKNTQQQSWRLIDVLSWASEWFKTKKIPHHRRDAEQLLASVLGCKRIELYMYYDRLLSIEERERYKKFINRRAKREPLAYIIGDTDFYGYEFKVGDGVLVPRAETEILVEKALNTNLQKNASVLDIGTGSGNIACTMALERIDLKITAIEISPEAYKWAEINLKNHNLTDKINLYLGDFLDDKHEQFMTEPFDLILANPPYIAQTEMPHLEAEVRDYEPKTALIGGRNGDELPILQLKKIANCIKNDGQMFMEIGSDQGASMLKIAKQLFKNAHIEIIRDLTNRDRILYIAGRWHG